MTQLELVPECRVPDPDTQTYRILLYLQRGGKLTVAKAFSELGVFALSQRCTDLRKMGWPIRSRALKVGPKTYVAEYTLGEV